MCSIHRWRKTMPKVSDIVVVSKEELTEGDKLPSQKEIEIQRNQLLQERNEISREKLEEYKKVNKENNERFDKLEKKERRSIRIKIVLLITLLFACLFIEFVYDFGLDKTLSLSFIAIVLMLSLDILNYR